jgi:hypothetical protein
VPTKARTPDEPFEQPARGRRLCTVWYTGGYGYCRQYAVPGTNPPRCAGHQGHHRRLDRAESADFYVRTKHMGQFYHRTLKSTVREKVEEYLAVPHEEQLSLFEELAVTRASAEQKVAEWDQAVLALEQETDPKKRKIKQELADLAAYGMRQALNEVRDMCLAAARVESSQRGLVTPLMLQLFVNQMVRLFYRQLPQETAEMLEKHIRDFRLEVKLPEDYQSQGTDLLPDQTVLLMDQTVPHRP